MDKLTAYMRNLKRKKLRTFLAIIGIAIGVFSIITVISIGRTGKDIVIEEIDSLGLNGLSVESESYPLTEAELSRVRQVVSRGVMPLIVRYSPARLRTSEVNAVLIGSGSNVCEVTGLEIIHGRAFTEKETKGAAKVCILSSDCALSAYSRENICGKSITLLLGDKEVDLKIVGVSAAGSGSLSSLVGEAFPAILHIPYTTAEKFCASAGFDRISIVNTHIDPITAAKDIEKRLNAYAGDKEAYTVTDYNRERGKYTRILDAVTAVVSGIGGISLLVAGLMIMTLMLVSVSERSHEIGVKKALGATSSHIVLEFLTESAIISALGGALGLGLSYAAALAVRLVSGISLTVTPEVILLGLLLAGGTGIIFGVYPAFKASKLRPSESLRR